MKLAAGFGGDIRFGNGEGDDNNSNSSSSKIYVKNR